MPGKYFLEVKNYINTSLSAGKEKIGTQIANHFKHYPTSIGSEAVVKVTGRTITDDTAPGLVFRFAASNGNLAAYREFIKNTVRSKIRRAVKNSIPSDTDLELEEILDLYIDNKVIIEGV